MLIWKNKNKKINNFGKAQSASLSTADRNRNFEGNEGNFSSLKSLENVLLVQLQPEDVA